MIQCSISYTKGDKQYIAKKMFTLSKSTEGTLVYHEYSTWENSKFSVLSSSQDSPVLQFVTIPPKPPKVTNTKHQVNGPKGGDLPFTQEDEDLNPSQGLTRPTRL